MKPRDIVLIFTICLVWGLHFPVIRHALDTTGTSPILYAALRMSLLALLLAPWLRIYTGRMPALLAAGTLLGGVNYALIFSGLKYASASAAAIAIELVVPISTILAIVLLGERVGLRRLLSIAMAFCGVVLIVLEPNDTGLGIGVMLIACAALGESVGAILIRKLDGVPPLRIQAWVALCGSIVTIAGTLLFESGQATTLTSMHPTLVGAVLYSALGASLFGHTCYYGLLQRNEITTVQPFTLVIPVITMVAGITLLDETVTLMMIGGAVLTLAGVAMLMIRPTPRGLAVVDGGTAASMMPPSEQAAVGAPDRADSPTGAAVDLRKTSG